MCYNYIKLIKGCKLKQKKKPKFELMQNITV